MSSGKIDSSRNREQLPWSRIRGDQGSLNSLGLFMEVTLFYLSVVSPTISCKRTFVIYLSLKITHSGTIDLSQTILLILLAV